MHGGARLQRTYGEADGDAAAMLGEHSSNPDDTLEDVFEERGGKLAPKKRPENQE